MEPKLGFNIKKPVSFWFRQIKTEPKSLFAALAKTSADVLAGQTVAAVKDVVDYARTLGFENDPAHAAWVLIFTALVNAADQLVSQNSDMLRKDAKKSLKGIEKSLESFEAIEVSIDRSFFDDPKNIAILPPFQNLFSLFLENEIGFTHQEAASIANRLPAYFVFSLIDEWNARHETYGVIKRDLADNPFVKAGEKERGIYKYQQWLISQPLEPVFGSCFSLKDVYIPLRAFYEKDQREIRQNRYVVDMTSYILNWVMSAERTDAIRIIRGGPGCGKSSFTKMLAAHLSEKHPELPVLFIPLHRFQVEKDLFEAIRAFVKDFTYLKHDPLDNENDPKPLFIIFDGLDELSRQGKVGLETSLAFLNELNTKIGNINYHTFRMKALVSGRDVSVQAGDTILRRKEQCLHVLPYRMKLDVYDEYIEEAGLFRTDQRHEWWKKYGKLIEKNYDGLPTNLDTDKLDEITEQPLLNYLLALSISGKKNGVETGASRNRIYVDLLHEVYNRKWGGERHAANKDITEVKFLRILEEIALCSWHGAGRTTSEREVEEHCRKAGLEKLFLDFKDGMKSGISRLFIAFYFRKSDKCRKDGDPTYEFTHKSFEEYLVAKRIVRLVETIQIQMDMKNDNDDLGWNKKDALVRFTEICGPSPMGMNLLNFIRDEIGLWGKTMAADWQKTLTKLFNHMLAHSMPMERIKPDNFHEAKIWERNAGETLMAVMNACCRITETISEIIHPHPKAIKDWLNYVKSTQNDGNIIHDCMSYGDYEGVNLSYFLLLEANLERSNLKGAYLFRANLFRANLIRANLEEATLEEANLQGAFFFFANLLKAKLQNAILAEAILERANLQGTNLIRANLQGAILQRADLRGANLQRADLKGANLLYTILNGSDLTNATIDDETDFTGADLTGAIWIDGTPYNGQLERI